MGRVLSVIALAALAAPAAALNFGLPRRVNSGARAGSKATAAPKAVALPAEELRIGVNNVDGNWMHRLDYEAFKRDVQKLEKGLQADAGDADVDHLKKIVRWSNAAAAVGVATMWMAPNPVTVAALSTWVFSRWTIIAHHTCHGGYNRVDAGRYHSRGFAIGSLWRRTRDWMDWMLPEAWSVEHNKLHHYRLGEDADPDLVERNLQWLREKDAPMALKYVMATALIPVWKWVYYAPNTFKELCIAEARKSGEALPEKFRPEEAVTVATLLAPQNEHEEAARDFIGTGRFFGKVLAPNFFLRFLALPAPLLLLPGGATLFGHALVNLALADLVTNIHSFIVIVTNHAGDDLYKFEDEVKPKTGSFYVRQIVSSTNFDLGSDKVDFAHGWLNYQIEHHVWDSMSPLQYQKGAPALREICEKHGVPYVKMNVFQRLKKTLDIMVGATDMLPFPADAEPKGDKRVRAAAAAAAAAN